MSSNFRSVGYMTDAELMAAADALALQADQDALTNPVTLARHLSPQFRARAHLRMIGNALADLKARSGRRLMILTPPQIGKSTTVAVWGTFWWLCLFPTNRVLVASYGNSLAVTRGRQVRRLVQEHGHKFGLAMERGSQTVNDWTLTEGGGIKSVGIGTGIAGFPGDLAVVDDPHKSRVEAESLRKRDAVSEWWSGDLTSRLSPGAPVVLVLTPWHPDDLRGRLLAAEGTVEEGGRWKVVKLPAFACENDPLGREIGAPLTHPKIPSSDIEALTSHWNDKKRGSSLRDWYSLYMCDPRPQEGSLVSEALMIRQRFHNHDVRGVTHVVAVDPSGGGKDTAGIIAGFRGTDGRVYWTHDLSGHMSTEQWPRVACELAHRIGAERIVAEDNYGGDMPLIMLKTAWDALVKDRGFPAIRPRIEPSHAKKNKRLRAEPVAQLLMEDQVRTLTYMPELEQEWCEWVEGHQSPGRIDASVYLTYALMGNGTVEIASPSDGPGPVLPSAPGARPTFRATSSGLLLPQVPGTPRLRQRF